MSTHIRLEQRVYDKIAARKRENETFSEALDRLVGDWSLAEWGERYAIDEEQATAHRTALADIEETGRERHENLWNSEDS